MLLDNQYSIARFVIEVRDDSGDDPAVEFALAALHRQGHRMTLERWDSTRPPSALWDIATTIKVDMRNVSVRQPKGLAETTHSQGVKALAAKIETRQQFELCKAVGSHEFQGKFLSKPEIVEHRNVPPTIDGPAADTPSATRPRNLG